MNTEAVAHCGSTVASQDSLHDATTRSCNGGVIQGELAGASAAGFPMPNTSQYGADDAPYYPNTTDLPNPSGTDSSAGGGAGD